MKEIKNTQNVYILFNISKYCMLISGQLDLYSDGLLGIIIKDGRLTYLVIQY